VNLLAATMVPVAALGLAMVSVYSPTTADRAATASSAPPTGRPAAPEPLGGGSSARAQSSREAAGVARPQADLTPTRRWRWPLAPRPAVVRPFQPPATRYGAGHRGIDLTAMPGQSVTTVADGTVTHVSVIAGRGTVTVTHPSGVRSTYEPVAAVVTVGDVLRAGAAVGRVEGQGSHCDPRACLHLGAIRGGEYLDPLVLLGAGRVRLLPLAGFARSVPDGAPP
jgi:murein DD-endopeptidase MepM/ murein hydrolase activator NlpD